MQENQLQEWPFRKIIVLFIVIFLVGSLLSASLCGRWQQCVAQGAVQNAIFILYGLFIVRLVVAKLLHETGRGWIVYLVIIATSFIWMPILFYVIELSVWGGDSPLLHYFKLW